MTKKQVMEQARKTGESPYWIMVKLLAKQPNTLSDLRKVYAKFGMVFLSVGKKWELQDATDGHVIGEEGDKLWSIEDLIENADQLSNDWDSTNFGEED
jgi:hypothetical protein